MYVCMYGIHRTDNKIKSNWNCSTIFNNRIYQLRKWNILNIYKIILFTKITTQSATLSYHFDWIGDRNTARKRQIRTVVSFVALFHTHPLSALNLCLTSTSTSTPADWAESEQKSGTTFNRKSVRACSTRTATTTTTSTHLALTILTLRRTRVLLFWYASQTQVHSSRSADITRIIFNCASGSRARPPWSPPTNSPTPVRTPKFSHV